VRPSPSGSFAPVESRSGSTDAPPTPAPARNVAFNKATTEESFSRPEGAGPDRRLLIGGALLVLAVGAALLLWPRRVDSPPEGETIAADTAPAPSVPEPTAPPAVPEPEAIPLPAVSAKTPPPAEKQPTVGAAVTPEKTPTDKAAADKTTATKTTDKNSLDSLPYDTDIETLANVVNGTKCGTAIGALRVRVAKYPHEARSWALLTTCYTKRKRWKNALEAYDKVVEYGDSELIDSIDASANKARAAIAAAEAAGAPETTAAPSDSAPQ
jgi:hypothetical protein